ncbi:hypothetical protein OS493_036564 [Desmophyllum pertusum]|uniref:SEA domain-containing protein n=1 Tax=Desmophyllum pertusum TaxID=174260 RepID=A0A9X0CJ50_9CNID|nr:hypothetical protein OS493_036564 [Desmophyllum pertusum]
MTDQSYDTCNVFNSPVSKSYFVILKCLLRIFSLAFITFYLVFQVSFDNQPTAMPSSKSTRFDVANFMKTRKEMRQKAVDQSRSLKTELNTINRKINRLKSKVNDGSGVLCDMTNQNENIQPGTHPSTPGGRTRPPTHLVKGKSNLPVRTAVKRRHETMVAASVIHGGSENYPKPALDGIFDTLNKRCKLDSMQQYVLSNETLTDKVVSTVYKKNVSSFEKSSTNVKRSIATFYSSGIMGKRKYQAVRLALSMKKIEEYFQDATEDDLVRGCFRKLEEFLPRLAQFYLRKDRKESLKWFGYPQGTLLVALGGDGCPFGKNESACTFLASFLNVGKKVASNNENFVIFGANCEESCSVVKKYVQFLCQEIADLQGKVFDIEGIKGTFGTNGNTMWRPWKYEERVAVANQVDKFKQSLSTKQLPAKQLRTKGILKEAIAKSKLPVSCKKFVDVPKDSPFSQVVTALKFEVKAKCLARKVAKWYDETQGNGQDLQYRFTVTEISPTSNKITAPTPTSEEQETEGPETELVVELRIQRTWDNDLRDENSKVYKELSFLLEKEILKQYSQNDDFVAVEILSFEPGSVVVEFKLTFKRKLEDEEALGPLKKYIKDGKMGSLNVDPESLEVKKYSEEQTDAVEDEKKIPYTLIIGVSCGGAFILAIFTICGIRYCQRKHPINRLQTTDGMPAEVVFSRAEKYELEDIKSKEDIVRYEEIGISNAAVMCEELGRSKDSVRSEKLDFSNDAARYQVAGKPNDAGD